MSGTKKTVTSWQNVSDWYGRTVGREGHYYHQHVILPQSLRLLELQEDSSLLDLACGQGVLARQLPETVYYVGVDAAPALIREAKHLDKKKNHVYLVADASRKLAVAKTDFSHAAVILALQNIKDADGVFENACRHLREGGHLLIVLNHPYFRIPRHTRWEIDARHKIEYRRIDRYLTPLTIPITTHPGRGDKSPATLSYHRPLNDYSQALFKHGFVIEQLEEWTSDKHSVGEAAKMENRARQEFPMFMALLARKT
ncbi:MAG: class I SAM-dependent methyltransferase [Dehalococcoidales bacterium]|nr:class I SAM-dependent methyltransferase [Dehalococcoidales bacterium]